MNQPEEPKRGRGRPRLECALSVAERSRLYRERKKAKQEIIRGATENRHPSVGLLESRIVLLNAENIGLSNKLEAALDEIAALKAKIKPVARHKK